MTNLFLYQQDGACPQAKAVLAYLQESGGIHESWNDEHKRNDAEPSISRWENCREQGYVISMKNNDFSKQLNIAFFEHRNSDDICAIKWEEHTINAPTINSKELSKVYKTKWDVSHEVGYGKAQEMARWIMGELVSFWITTQKKVVSK